MTDGLAGVDAVVLAGGLGTRLAGVVADRPKAMAPVAGRPFLEHQLERLARAGVRRAVVCIGHRGAQIQAHFGDGFAGLALDYAVEETLLGTGGALRNGLLRAATDTVLALNGDSWCEADLAAFRAFHAARGAVVSLLLTQVPDCARYGRVDTDADGRVVRFAEKAAVEGPGWINGGVYLVARGLVDAISAGRPVSLEREVFPMLVGRGLYGFAGGGRFLDIGTPESYAAADAFFGG